MLCDAHVESRSQSNEQTQQRNIFISIHGSIFTGFLLAHLFLHEQQDLDHFFPTVSFALLTRHSYQHQG